MFVWITKIERDCENKLGQFMNHTGFTSSRALDECDTISYGSITSHGIYIVQHDLVIVTTVFTLPSQLGSLVPESGSVRMT